MNTHAFEERDVYEPAGRRPPLTVEDVILTQAMIAPHARRTPIERSPGLSEALEADVYLKLENLQIGGNLKVRGALRQILKSGSNGYGHGVVAAFSGMHSRSLACAAKQLRLPLHILMPAGTPPECYGMLRRYGAACIDLSKGFHERAIALSARDEKSALEGGATIGLEMWEDLPRIDAVLAPAASGTMLSGLAFLFKSISSPARIYGVSAISGRVPETNFSDGCYMVDDRELHAAMRWLYEYHRLVTEPLGAAAVAGALKNRDMLRGKRVVLLISGGVIDPSRFARIVGTRL